MGTRPRWTYKNQIWHKRSHCRRNHLFQILSKSVKGFPGCEGQKMGVSHWLWQSPLQQVSTTVLPVILSKVRLFSIPVNIVKWIISSFTGGFQSIKVNGVCSLSTEITSSIMQWCAIGPYRLVFTARRHSLLCWRLYYLRASLSARPSVRLSVRLSSVTRWYCVQTNEATIMRFSPSGSTIILVSGEVKIFWKFAGDHP